MKIVFLDVDGVLNSPRSMIAWHQEYKGMWHRSEHRDEKTHLARNHIDPIAVKLLNRVTDGCGAKYVISSTHRKHIPDPLGNGRDMQEMKRYFAMFGLTGEVIGYTGCDPRGFRGNEVNTWLEYNQEKYGVTHYAIIDDDGDFTPQQKEYNLVQTSQEDGFLYTHFKHLCKVLDYKDEP